LNPALPILVGGVLTGLALRRREAGRALLVGCLAGLALLIAVLVVPDGVPGGAADLGRRVPWQSAAAESPGNPALQDVTYQIYPWLLYLRHELRAARLPFWNPHQFSGMTFWGNGQSAPLSPFHLLFVLLPLQLGLILLPWSRVVVAAAGTYYLGRELELSPWAAAAAAVVFPLSGMFVSFALYPMGSALALVPWIFWAVERLATGRGGWSALALAGAVQMVSGHPETALHCALLSVLYLAVRCREWRWQPWLRLAVGWTVAGALAAVVLLPLAGAVGASSRWQQAAELGGPEPGWRTLLALPLRAVLPDLFGNPARGTWWGPFNYLATAVYAGALALPLAALGGAGWRGDRRRLAWIAVLLFSAAAAYRLAGLREVLTALPLVGHALHHRLLFGVELALAVLTGLGIDAWLAGRSRPAVWGAMAAGAAIVAGWVMYRRAWLERGLDGEQLRWALWLGALLCALLASLALAPALRSRGVPLLVGLIVLDLVLAHQRLLPVVPLREVYPPTGATAFLSGRHGRVAAMADALRPNAAMVYGLDDVRGDDSLKPRRYEDVLSVIGEHHPAYFVPVDRWQSPWLDRLAVRWVMAPPHAPAAAPGWALAYDGADARVYERSSAFETVRWRAAPAGSIEVREHRPGLWRIRYSAGEAGRLIVAEGWDPGWRAELDGHRRAVLLEDGALMSIDVPAGSGELVMRYTPAGIRVGALSSCLAAALLLAGWRRGW
jgi:hypothetical protein